MSGHDHAAEEKIRTARARVAFLRSYFTHAIFALVLVQEEHCQTMAVDEWRRLYYAPSFVHAHSIEELATVLLHELEHVLRDHCRRARQAGVTHQTLHLAQIAEDCSVNEGLRQEATTRPQDRLILPEPKDPELLKLPEDMRGPWFPEKIGCPEGLAWETYYHHLLDHAITIEVAVDCGSGAHGVRRPWEAGEPGPGSAEGVTDGDWHFIQQLTAEAIQARHRNKGDVPGSWEEWSSAFLRPKRIPWDDALRAYLRGCIAQVAGAVDYTYEFPSRLYHAVPNVVLPAMHGIQPRLCMIGDTSGSMSAQHDLALVRGVVTDLCDQFATSLVFLATDAEVHGGAQEVQDGYAVRMIGRGGTDMGAGITAALRLQPRPDVLIVATDCATDWPERAPGIPVVICGIGAPTAWFDHVPSWALFIHVEVANAQATQAK